MTESRIVVRIPTAATSASASSGPPIAPTLSIARSSPYARPYASGGATSASSALRAGPRRPRATQPAILRSPACHTAVASSDRGGEDGRRRVPADRGRPAALRIVGERSAAEAGDSAEPVREPFDHAERRGRSAERARQEGGKEGGRDLVAEIGEQARAADRDDAAVQPVRLSVDRRRG